MKSVEKQHELFTRDYDTYTTCNICSRYRGCGEVKVSLPWAAKLTFNMCASCAQEVLDQIPKKERDRQKKVRSSVD